MRKLIYSINVSLDGCCDHTKMGADEELHEFYVQQLRDGDTLLYGRKTYELMVPFWPDMAKNESGPKDLVDFGKAFVAVKNIVVVSKTLNKVDEKNTTIIRTNLKEEILKLKQQPGKPILAGGVDVPAQLIELGLVDEFRFVIQPIVVGEGRRVSEGANLAKGQDLKLVESKTFNSGAVALRYVRK
ncbi:MAG TPA: dihydrofolate reductase family protein [Cyclobacteriaceae bacterium]|nr:dihydrofolate reductase family protein [Cyclobacteriaceae bacterium]